MILCRKIELRKVVVEGLGSAVLYPLVSEGAYDKVTFERDLE